MMFADEPFGADVAADTFRETVSFFDATAPPAVATPWNSPNRDLTIIRVDPRYGLCVIRTVGSGVGDPTTTFERLLGVPATTRTRGTITRLLAKVP